MRILALAVSLTVTSVATASAMNLPGAIDFPQPGVFCAPFQLCPAEPVVTQGTGSRTG